MMKETTQAIKSLTSERDAGDGGGWVRKIDAETMGHGHFHPNYNELLNDPGQQKCVAWKVPSQSGDQLSASIKRRFRTNSGAINGKRNNP